MTTISHLIRPGGRSIAIHELTPAASMHAPVVVLCHPAPGTGDFDPDPAATTAHGVRLIGVDRPGYGGSDPIGDVFSTVAVAADDVIATAESVLPPGGTVGVAGWSAGGRVAAAVAARRPDLVRGVALIGTPAPDEAVPWYPDAVRPGIDALRGASPATAHAALAEAFAAAGSAGGNRLTQLGVGPADARVVADNAVVGRLHAMLDASVAHGSAGTVADIAGYTLQSWGFDPADVKAEVLLGYGAQDRIGVEHGRWWASVLPHSRLDVLPDVGHLVVVPVWDRVLTHLA